MKLIKIETGNFMCDGGAVFGAAPKVLWNRNYPCDEENFCNMAMRSLLIDTGERKILIDAGLGNKQSDKFYSFFKLNGDNTIHSSLSDAGYKPEDITDVILTHLHFDHCGWCTYFDDDKELQLTFPKAKHWVGITQWKNYLSPNKREGDAYFLEDMMPVSEAGLLYLVDGDMEIAPGITVRQFHGHTPGQLIPYISYKDKTIIYAGDLIPVAQFVAPAWVSAYDTYPVTTLEEKEGFLKETYEQKQILFLEHDLYTECCTVDRKDNGKYIIREKMTLEEAIK